MFRVALPLTLFALACSNVETPPKFGPGDSGSDDTDTDTDTDADTDTDTVADDTGDSGSTPASSTFDDPGDVVDFQDSDGVANIDLTDQSGDSNQDQEFYLVLLNTTEAEIGYQLRYYDAAAAADRPAPPSTSASRVRPGPAHVALPRGPTASPPPPPSLSSADIGETRDEFLVRSDLEDSSLYEPVRATLWALGDNVAIWVDDEVPIDYDEGCDGTVDRADERDAFGFDNCDLADVAEIIDSNIIPNVEALYGEASDQNGDGRISVVITPQLNAITLTSDDEREYTRVLPSYAEPNVDLAEWDYETNPGSDEQEVIYVFAPDPHKFFNHNVAPTVEAFTGYQLAAEVARSFTALVSYNQHFLIPEAAGEENIQLEEDWVVDILGTFAAEYCGFGANYYPDAWEYLDAPHRFPLESGIEPGSLAAVSRGAPYLYGLYLYDFAEAQEAGSGAALMSAISQSDSVGASGLDATLATFDSSFSATLVRWQVALLTSGVENIDGGSLVDETEWPPYAGASTISAPPDSPGTYYGANGYQRGLELNGINHAFRYGTTDDPEEIESNLVKMENLDAYTYVPGFDFFGWVDAGYAAQAIRLSDIPYDEAVAQLQANGSGLIGAVVRWNDPDTSDIAVEDIFAPTSVDAVSLPALPDDGSRIYGVGELSIPSALTAVDPDGNEEDVPVDDTDRWLLDLTDRGSSETVTVAVWLERHFASTDGDMSPEDPWIAVVPRDYVAEPTVDGTARGSTCPDGPDFQYPESLLEYLDAQIMLSSTMYSGDEDDFDACGEQSVDPTTCADDWDRDGVLDADEPQPTTFLEQVRVMECTLNGNVQPASWEVDSSWLDVDEQDENSLPTQDFVNNTGGHSGVDGEEGYVEVSLQGGREYLVIVGASGGGTGVYEINARQVE